MRPPHFVPFLAVLALATRAVPAQVGSARPTTLQPVPELRIDALKERVTTAALLAVGPDGRIIVAPNYGDAGIVGFDSTGKRLPWRVATGNSDSVEIRSTAAIGWQWPNMLVIDPSYKQIAVVSAQGKVTKSIEYPSWIRPTWADRRKFPVFSRMEVLAVYADGSLLVVPRGDAAPIDTPEYDSQSRYLLRISAAGSIQRTIGKIPLDGPMVVSGRGEIRVIGGSPPGARLWAATMNGSRVVVVSAPNAGRDSGLIRVTTLSDRGDTVFSRTYPYAPVKVAQKTIDSAVARARRNGATTAQINAIKSPAPVAGVRMGRDQTTWLTLHETDQGQPYLGLDTRGEPIGVFVMPPVFSLQEADHDHAWGIERNGRSTSAQAIVRYRITAKKP